MRFISESSFRLVARNVHSKHTCRLMILRDQRYQQLDINFCDLSLAGSVR